MPQNDIEILGADEVKAKLRDFFSFIKTDADLKFLKLANDINEYALLHRFRYANQGQQNTKKFPPVPGILTRRTNLYRQRLSENPVKIRPAHYLLQARVPYAAVHETGPNARPVLTAALKKNKNEIAKTRKELLKEAIARWENR